MSSSITKELVVATTAATSRFPRPLLSEFCCDVAADTAAAEATQRLRNDDASSKSRKDNGKRYMPDMGEEVELQTGHRAVLEEVREAWF